MTAKVSHISGARQRCWKETGDPAHSAHTYSALILDQLCERPKKHPQKATLKMWFSCIVAVDTRWINYILSVLYWFKTSCDTLHVLLLFKNHLYQSLRSTGVTAGWISWYLRRSKLLISLSCVRRECIFFSLLLTNSDIILMLYINWWELWSIAVADNFYRCFSRNVGVVFPIWPKVDVC